ncbi:MAG: DUF4124 domain-containing protein [Pseudomonadota bacterium]
MNSNWLKGVSIIAFALASLSQTTIALAQYVWVNENGVKQYSDMPPPSSVPKSRILKAPGAAARTPSAPEAAPGEARDEKGENSGTAAAKKDKAPMTVAEKNADFQKRKIEQAEKDKKAAEKERMAADKAKNCERAQNYNRILQSGTRISTSDKNGERQYLNDEQRAREAKETREILDDCK